VHHANQEVVARSKQTPEVKYAEQRVYELDSDDDEGYLHEHNACFNMIVLNTF
jgi:hypothetical protein